MEPIDFDEYVAVQRKASPEFDAGYRKGEALLPIVLESAERQLQPRKGFRQPANKQKARRRKA